MQTYSLSRQELDRYRRRWIILGICVCLLVVGAMGYAAISSLLTNLDEVGLYEPEDWVSIISEALFAFVPMVATLGIFWFVWRRQFNQYQAIWQSVRVELGADYVARWQLRVPEVRLLRDEITRLQETRAGLCIYTGNKYHLLSVPRSLENYEQVKATLSSWVPLTQPPARGRAFNIAVAIGTLVGMGIIFLSLDLRLVLGAGIILSGYFGYSLWALGRYEGVDPRYRRSIFFLVVWLVFITLMKVLTLVMMSPYM